MARQTSPRYQIQYVDPTLRNEPADVPAEIKRLVDAIEQSTMFTQGPIASRPAAGTTGRFYYANNEGILYYDYGTGWQAVGPPVPGATIPAGSIIQFAGANAPPGFLICDGASLAVATYPDLHAAIGFAYGGSGANFNLPNLKGRIPVGRDAAQAEFDVVGEAGGAKTHALDATQMPVHSHVVNNHDHGTWTGYVTADHVHSAWTDTQGQHGHTSASGSPLAVDAQINAGAAGTSRHTVAGEEGGTSQNGAHGHNIGMAGASSNHQHQIGAQAPGTNAQGGGLAHNNLQPYIVMNYIIRTGNVV